MVLLGLGCVTVCSGCGGGLEEGIPSNIDPNKPSASVKGMLKQGAQMKEAVQASRAKDKRGTDGPDPAAIPKKIPAEKSQ